VLTNLVSNAVKFTDHGEIVVRVEKESETERVVMVRSSVADTGIGIPPEVLPRLFQAFSQADGSTTRRFGGTGLGLAISKRLVELMGGKIGIDSQPGRGSMFWFTLPLEKQPAATIPPLRPAETRSLAGLRVLIVDDNATQRGFLRQQAEAWRMNHLVAGSGEEALALLRREAAAHRPFDLVVADTLAPPVDGVGLARAIRADPALSKARVVLLTTMANRLDRDSLEQHGIAACLTKPVKQSRLHDILSQAAEDLLLATPAPSAQLADNTVFITAKPAAPVRPVRILLVEDNVVNQKVTLRQLQKLGYSADAVANGLEALEALRRFPYSIILMDCQMPEMDGYEATRHIRQMEERQRSQGTPRPAKVIIALTAKALQGDREKCIEAGMDDYVSKPVQISELEAALQRAVETVGPSPGNS
jgi:CheY-like chemotaxis protein